LADKLAAAGVQVKSNLSSVEETDVDRVLQPSKGKTGPSPAAGKAAQGEAPKRAARAAKVPAAAPETTAAPETSAAVGEAEVAAPVAPATSAPAEAVSDPVEPAATKAPAPKVKPAPSATASTRTPGQLGPRIVATAEELKAKEELAAAARAARAGGAPQRGRARGKGSRLEDMPTVVGPGVPVRKGVKPSGTVLTKGAEPPKPPEPPQKPAAAAPPEAGAGPADPGGEARPAGPPRPGGGPRAAAPRPGATDRPSEAGKRSGARPVARRPGAEAAGPAPARIWRADDKPTRRRMVIDSQASRRGKTGAPLPRGVAAVEVEKPAVKNRMVPGTESPVTLASGATVKDMADILEMSSSEIIKTMMKLGEMVTITQSLTDEAIEILASEFERQVTIQHAEEESDEPTFADDAADLITRAPVVTIMGHVDHGKTSLLDAVRETEVVKSEAGGITQHIGAYQVTHKDKPITFIDTPGHEAFTAMRARGAKVTDIAVIVVAANDGVMPQTTEAIDHAKAAEVPMVVAINKMDLSDANPDRVKQQLSEQGLVPEEWGGDTVMVEVSAKKHLHLDELLDMVLLVAEVQELKANPKAEASGVVVEAQLDVGRGPVATMLVQRGTLRVGDAVVSGEAYGKVKAMFDFMGDSLDEAGPAVPVQILGFNAVPAAGDFAQTVKDEREARHRAEGRTARLRMEQMAKGRAATSLDDFYRRMKEEAVQELALIIKGDVGGSVEALEEALKNVSHPEVKVQVIHSGVGGINESDIMLASASNAVVIGFNVRPSVAAKALAEAEGVDVRTYRVIYKAIEDVEAALVGMLTPDQVEEELGTAEVRKVFYSSKIGAIAGSYVQSGRIVRGARMRLLRDGSIVHEGSIATLRRDKDDAREVLTGFECGIHLDSFDDIKEGDIIEAYEIKEVARTK
jgi:translation initiation factor IF-2